MNIEILDNYNEIVIQMHNNPDADAVGSGFALYDYLSSKGKSVRLIYGGERKITKSNILLLINDLNIPVEYVTSLEAPELLLTVDCQYGEGNVQHFPARNVAIIDHHNTGRTTDEMCEIRSHIVSCSTVIYDMLSKQNYDVNKRPGIATALYYGLYMDSNGFSEIRHPIERDMMEFLNYDKALLKRLCHSNFTLEELETAGIALLRHNYDPGRRFSIISSKPCDPNILGIIGDIMLQVDSIDVSIIYNECQDGYKLSVRSCITEVAANDLTKFLTMDVGNGGGHTDKSGGFISHTAFAHKYGDLGIDTYFFDRVTQYFDGFKVIYAKDGVSKLDGFSKYYKQKSEYGYVPSLEIAPEGTELRLRNPEGDVFIQADANIYIMVGIDGEVYPIEKSTFDKKYTAYDKPFIKEYEYTPNAYDIAGSHFHELSSHLCTCVPCTDYNIFAKKLDFCAKVFSKWDYEKYLLGEPGDYLCYPEGNEQDLYVVKGHIFERTYVLAWD